MFFGCWLSILKACSKPVCMRRLSMQCSLRCSMLSASHTLCTNQPPYKPTTQCKFQSLTPTELKQSTTPQALKHYTVAAQEKQQLSFKSQLRTEPFGRALAEVKGYTCLQQLNPTNCTTRIIQPMGQSSGSTRPP